MSTSTNTSNLPVEALEIEYPLTLLRYELVDGSGGAGQYRGGMGLRRVYQATHDCRVRVDVSRQRSQSWGLFGGGAGAHGKVEAGPGVVFDGDSAVLKAGQWFALVTPGAGGFGPPARARAARPPARSRRRRDQRRDGARRLRRFPLERFPLAGSCAKLRSLKIIEGVPPFVGWCFSAQRFQKNQVSASRAQKSVPFREG